MNISCKDNINNEEVRRKTQAGIGEYDELLTMVKKRKLRWLDYVSMSSGLAGHGEEVDERRGGNAVLKNGQGTLPAQLGQLKTGKNGKGLLRSRLWCLSDLARLWDRLD